MIDMLNSFALNERAARGDVEAQRQLAKLALAYYLDEPCPFVILEAITYARLAATHGDPKDAGFLLSLFGIASDALREVDPSMRQSINAEAIAFAAVLAERGVEHAEWGADAMVAASSPDAVADSLVIFEKMTGKRSDRGEA